MQPLQTMYNNILKETKEKYPGENVNIDKFAFWIGCSSVMALINSSIKLKYSQKELSELLEDINKDIEEGP